MRRGAAERKDPRIALIEKIREDFPCFGHFSKLSCMNLGFLEYRLNPLTGIKQFVRCPYEASCKKMLLDYLRETDAMKEGKGDKPREWIRGIEQGKRTV